MIIQSGRWRRHRTQHCLLATFTTQCGPHTLQSPYHQTDLKPKQQEHKNHDILTIHTLLRANVAKETSRIFIWLWESLFLSLLCSCHNFCE